MDSQKRRGLLVFCVEAETEPAAARALLQSLNFLNNGHDDGAMLFLSCFQLPDFFGQIFVGGEHVA